MKTDFQLRGRLLAIGLMVAGHVAAQTFTTLHNFEPGDYAPSGLYTNLDGNDPRGLVLSSNALYGITTHGGPSGNGTLFKVNIDGTGFLTLYTFPTNPLPRALTLSGTTLYGTTASGGTWDGGTVFKIESDGTQFRELHSFAGYNFTGSTDGSNPGGRLVLSGNTLYGDTANGGFGINEGPGTVFRINTDGTGYTILYTFSGGTDGATPWNGLLLAGNTLYGTATEGGSSSPGMTPPGNGTVFAISANGAAFRSLHVFTAGTYSSFSSNVITNSDGAEPFSALVLSGNTLYGTTESGGGSANGVVFAINTNGTEFTTL